MVSKGLLTGIVDWVLLIIFYCVIQVVSDIEPFERQFSLDDVTISHPHKGDSIKMSQLMIFCFVFTLVIIIACQLYKRSLKSGLNQAILGLYLSYFFTGFICNVISRLVGRYRPDFLSVCNVDFSKIEQQNNMYNSSNLINYGPSKLYDLSICTASPKDLIDERLSFPSGHSFTSSSYMSFIALYIAGQIHLLDGKSYIWKYFAVAIPYIIAIAVASSRVHDYRHHWQDVLAGSLIGFIVSTLTYFYFYPSLKHPNCDVPRRCQKDKAEVKKEMKYTNEYVIL